MSVIKVGAAVLLAACSSSKNGATPSTGGSTTGTAITSLGINGGTLRISANYSSGGTNQTEQDNLALTHDLLVINSGYINDPPPNYSKNPNIIETPYQSWFDTNPANPDYANIKEDWYYHDASGNRIATYGTQGTSGCDVTTNTFANCRLGLNLGNADLQAYVQAILKTAVGLGHSGVFFDNMSSAWPYRPGKVTSHAVTATPKYSDGHTQTESDWIADAKSFLQAMKDAVGADKVILFNGCENSSAAPLSKDGCYQFLEAADGCEKENWVVDGDAGNVAKVGDAWKTDIDLFEGVASQFKWAFPIVGYKLDDKTLFEYGAASALLIWRDGHMAANFWKTSGEKAVQGTSVFYDSFPWAKADLGEPSEARQAQANGLYTRTFSKGFVVVNPTSASQTFDLPASYCHPGETSAVSSPLSLPSGTGAVLVSCGG